MDESVRQLQVLLDLDARHDDLLDRLDDLDKRVAQVLGEWMVGRNTSMDPTGVAVDPTAGEPNSSIN